MLRILRHLAHQEWDDDNTISQYFVFEIDCNYHIGFILKSAADFF
jgi:hypothetical protein